MGVHRESLREKQAQSQLPKMRLLNVQTMVLSHPMDENCCNYGKLSF